MRLVHSKWFKIGSYRLIPGKNGLKVLKLCSKVDSGHFEKFLIDHALPKFIPWGPFWGFLGTVPSKNKGATQIWYQMKDTPSVTT